MDDARRRAEQVARTSYGRLVAILSARSGDIAAAEDALGEAFRAALSAWPASGVPDRPEAWLLTAARRSLGHGWRHDQVRGAARAMLDLLNEEAEMRDHAVFPDERLKLLFVCAHPAIDESVRTPLMLQTVLGLTADQIGAAFLTSPAAMGQRLVRAKAKIKAAGIRFEAPEGEALAPRLAAVLAAIFAAYGTSWNDGPGTDTNDGLGAEAIFLARVMVALLPAEPEATGLLALLLYCEARAAARMTADGGYVPLEEQDVGLWQRPMIVEAEELLARAARSARFGRYQVEAAIQSLHVTGRAAGGIDDRALLHLYDLLAGFAPTAGVLVARAVALGRVAGPHAALQALDAIGAGAAQYQPAWAVRARMLTLMERPDEARLAYDRAIGLATDPGVRAWLASQKSALIPVEPGNLPEPAGVKEISDAPKNHQR